MYPIAQSETANLLAEIMNADFCLGSSPSFQLLFGYAGQIG